MHNHSRGLAAAAASLILLLAACGGNSGGGPGSSSSSSSSGGSSSGGSSSGGSSSGASGSSSSSGAPGVAATPYYLVYTATPTAGSSSSGGVSGTGLYVVPSNALGTTPLLVTSAVSRVMGVSEQRNVDNVGNVTGLTPYNVLYATSGAAGGDHFYALQLDATRTPAPVQVSNATLTALPCKSATVSLDVKQASNSALVYATRGADGQCGTADDQGFLIRYGDSATTAPISLAVYAPALEKDPTSGVEGLYDANGSFAGIVAVDASSGLSYYPIGNLSQPVQLLPNGYSVQTSYRGAGYSLIEVTASQGSPAQPGATTLYRLDASGHLSAPLIQFAGTPSMTAAVSGEDAYFTDAFASASTNGTPTSYSYSVIKTRLDGSGTTQTVYSNPSSTSSMPGVQVEGFVGTQAVISENGVAVYALDTATSGAALRKLVSTQGGFFNFIMPIAGNYIFVSYETLAPGFDDNTTLVVDIDGAHLREFDHTDLVGGNFGYSGSITSLRLDRQVKSVYLAQGATVTSGGDYGSTLMSLAPDTLAATPVTDGFTGQPYVLGADQRFIELYVDGMPANGTTSQSGGPNRDAMGFDAVNNKLYRYTYTPDLDESVAFY